MNRVSVYIDGGPLVDGIRGQGMSIDIDWNAMIKGLLAGSSPVEVHFFTSEVPEQPYPVKRANHSAFLESLRHQGINVHLAGTQVVGSQFVERGVETAFAVQLLTDAHSDKFDIALVVSRRLEFSAVLTAARNLGKILHTAFFHYDLSPTNPLCEFSDQYIELTKSLVIRNANSGPKPFFRDDN